MGTNEQIFELVKEKGPVLPAQISKQINESILMTSARLSELSSNKQIKISSIKVGGSPLYYVQGQENKLQDFVDNLPAVEKKAFELLKQNKILRDSFQEPAIRVALRQIKDFAVPLQVNYENRIEAFWKWYLEDNKDAESLIRNILLEKDPIKEQRIKEKDQEIQPKDKIPIATEQQSKLREKIEKETITQKTIKDTIRKEIVKKPKRMVDGGDFLKEVNIFFTKNKINVIENNEVKKNSESDFIVELETSIGKAKYFCKSKNKKKITEGDLSSALMSAQSKGFPLIFLTKGKLTKAAKEKLEIDFKGLIYKEI